MILRVPQEDLNKFGVYCIKSINDGRLYIGSTRESFYWRYKRHSQLLKKGRHGNIHLQRFVNIYGIQSLEFSVIEIVEDEAEVLQREQYYLNLHFPEGILFNIAQEAVAFAKGVKRSEETKEKIRRANLGKKYSEETRKKLSVARKGNKNSLGHIHSEETKEKMRNAKKGNTYSLGYEHTAETREKMKTSNAGKWLGRKHSEEAKEKIRAAWVKRKMKDNEEEVCRISL